MRLSQVPPARIEEEIVMANQKLTWGAVQGENITIHNRKAAREKNTIVFIVSFFIICYTSKCTTSDTINITPKPKCNCAV